MMDSSNKSQLIGINQPKRKRWEAEFLPSAIAIMETPTSPLPWIAAWSIITIISFTLIWSYLGSIDIVVVAQGRVEPKGFSRVVQSLETGRVKSILVDEGSEVKKGQPLIELDSREYQADLQRARQENYQARLTIARTDAELLIETSKEVPHFSNLTDIPSELIQIEYARMTSELHEQWAKISGLDQQIMEQRHNLESAENVIHIYGDLIPSLYNRYNAIKEMAKHGYASEVQVVEIHQKYADTKFNYETNLSRIKQINAALENLQEKKNQTIAEFSTRLHADATTARLKLVETEQSMARANYRIEQCLLTAPIDGVVFQLSTHTIGSVVQPAQQIMTIVPREAELIVEASLETKDAGFVEEGQEAEIKVDAFPFTRFGLLKGHVARISGNSTAMPQLSPNDPNYNQQMQQSSDQPFSRRNYTVTISLETNILHDQNSEIRVSSGMTTNVEIKTGTRRVLDYFLSPLAAKIKEAARER